MKYSTLIATSMLLISGCAGLTPVTHVASSGHESLRLKAIDHKTQAEACRLTAVELAANEKDEHAISQFEKAREFHPEIKGVSYPLAVLYDRQQKIDAARREYARAIEESPRNADIFNDYGFFLYSRGEYAAARTQLERALDLKAEHPKARVNLAMVLAGEGDFSGAFSHFEQAVGTAAAHHNLGLLQLRLGNEQEAIANLAEAAQLDPSLKSEQLMTTLIAQQKNESMIQPVSYTSEN